MEDLNKKRKFNYGIALLRTLMCFEVVLCHFWTTDVPKVLMPFSVLRGLAVPVFMFLSFFLTEHTFLEYNKNKAKKRIWRVIYPQIGWALIYWLGYTIISRKSGQKIQKIANLQYYKSKANYGTKKKGISR